MKKQALALAALTLFSMGAAMAEEAKPDFTLTGNAGLFSDYRFRGFTQTGYKPAFQGGFDVAHVSGAYVGNWNSNVEAGLYRGASMESDFYGGYKFAAGPVALDVGGIYYAYLSSSVATYGATKQSKQFEGYLGATYGDFSAKYSYGFTNFFGAGDGDVVDTKGNYYIDLGYAHDLGDGVGINAHYGYQYVKNATALTTPFISKSVSDYRLGVTKDYSGWVAGATLVATSKKDFAADVAGSGAGKTSLVLSVTKGF